MNLFESQIEKLNISPSMKQSVIELRKVCLESDVGVPPISSDFEKMQADAAKKKAEDDAIRDTARQAITDVSSNLPEDMDHSALHAAVMERIVQHYRPMIEKTYGEGSGERLETVAQTMLSRLGI